MEVRVVHWDQSKEVATSAMSANDTHKFVPFQAPLLFSGGEALEKSLDLNFL